MRTEEEIKERLQWLLQALDDEENQHEITQAKLWSQIDFIKWLVGIDKFIELRG
jgi:hypothetical protein